MFLPFGAPACEAPASRYSTGTTRSSPTFPSLTVSLISNVGGVPSFHAVPPYLCRSNGILTFFPVLVLVKVTVATSF